jgi:hypothetical protein
VDRRAAPAGRARSGAGTGAGRRTLEQYPFRWNHLNGFPVVEKSLPKRKRSSLDRSRSKVSRSDSSAAQPAPRAARISSRRTSSARGPAAGRRGAAPSRSGQGVAASLSTATRRHAPATRPGPGRSAPPHPDGPWFTWDRISASAAATAAWSGSSSARRSGWRVRSRRPAAPPAR